MYGNICGPLFEKLLSCIFPLYMLLSIIAFTLFPKLIAMHLSIIEYKCT